MVAAGEAPDEVANVDGAVNGGADSGGADIGTGGEKMALLLSRLAGPLLELAIVVADGDDWLLVHHFHSGYFLKWSSFWWNASVLYLSFSL